MISSGPEGTGLESRVAGWAARCDVALENMRPDSTFRSDDITVQGDLTAVRATSQETITIRATGETQPAGLRQLSVLERAGADWKVAQHMYQQMPEQLEGAAPASSGSATRIRAPSGV